MSVKVTLKALAATVTQTPWGPETVEPSADEVAINGALQALANGTPIPVLPATYLVPTPFGSMSFQYRPNTITIIANIAAIAAAL